MLLPWDGGLQQLLLLLLGILEHPPVIMLLPCDGGQSDVAVLLPVHVPLVPLKIDGAASLGDLLAVVPQLLLQPLHSVVQVLNLLPQVEVFPGEPRQLVLHVRLRLRSWGLVHVSLHHSLLLSVQAANLLYLGPELFLYRCRLLSFSR